MQLKKKGRRGWPRHLSRWFGLGLACFIVFGDEGVASSEDCGCTKDKKKLERFCDSLYNSDLRTCGRLKTPKGKNLCIASATARYGNCLAEKSLPDLVTWGDDSP
jgi:hypothetical protein